MQLQPAFSSQLPALLTFSNFRSTCRQLLSMGPVWLLFSDRPTNLLPELDFLSSFMTPRTNPFLCITHSGSVLLTKLWSMCYRWKGWWEIEWQMNLRNGTPNLSLLTTTVKPMLAQQPWQQADQCTISWKSSEDFMFFMFSDTVISSIRIYLKDIFMICAILWYIIWWNFQGTYISENRWSMNCCHKDISSADCRTFCFAERAHRDE